MQNDEEFFSKLRQAEQKNLGIPGVEMNAPLVSNTYKGTLGLELELEGNNMFPTTGYLEHIKGKNTGASWRAEDDGSLRGYSKEYVLSEPCDVSELPYLVNELFKVLEANRVTVENSNRCSTHVHVNMAGYKLNHITSILALWATFEEALIAWCGELRTSNHFCLSFKDSPSTIHAWNEYLRTGRSPRGRDLKYASLNILPLFTFGSLEFRCGRAADTPEIPVTWATFIHHFVKYATERFANPNELAFALSEQGGEEIFRELCRKAGLDELAGEVINSVPDFEKSCISGFRNVQNIVLGNPWEQWLELINREYVPNPFGGKQKKTNATGLYDFDRLRAVLDDPVVPPRPPRVPRYISPNDLGRINKVVGDTTISANMRRVYVWSPRADQIANWLDLETVERDDPGLIDWAAVANAEEALRELLEQEGPQ